MSTLSPCRICSANSPSVFQAKLLGHVPCTFFQCPGCGLLFSEKPYWLDEAYGSALSDLDTGLVQRNLALASRLSALILLWLGPKGRYLDAAGGCGLLVRHMRDRGFDFYWQDKYAGNLLARGFEEPSDATFSAVSAFEVLEHLEDPVGFIESTLARTGAGTLLFSTETYQGAVPPLDWPYYAFDTGQHIAFYQPKTLDHIARRLGLRRLSCGSFHVLTDRKLPQWVFRLLGSRWAGKAFTPINALCMRPLTLADSEALLQRRR